MPSVVGDRLEIVAGEGAWLTTAAGQRLLDAGAGLWHANVGHGRADIAEAAAEQMRTLETYHTFGRIANTPALDLADELAALAPMADARVFFTSGGSDSVDLACKLARRYWQVEGKPTKTTIASRHLGYHGLHGFGTSITGLESNRDGYGALSLVPETVRVATNDLALVRKELETLGGEHLAAVIAEPVIGTGGVVPPADGYLTGLQDLCRELDALFVVDEVITGFGRTGVMFACERFGLEPDMVLFAKGVTSGYAQLGGALIGRRVWEPFYVGADAPIFRHGLTYSGHATACTVGRANLRVLHENDLVRRAARLEPILVDACASLAEHDLVDEVRSGAGLLAGVQLRPEIDAEQLARACLDDGVLLRAITGNTLQICPPFVCTEDEIRQIVSAIEGNLGTVAAA
ncbi:MAG: aminotransferase class III-fold pyridoxal phosphate-dependent enzyme [Streptosporangiales bacterium]|nr:aminotransferase class III-fold pyridoxal phosphate-dependent enzyme [Streptosporangiales bacterium]